MQAGRSNRCSRLGCGRQSSKRLCGRKTRSCFAPFSTLPSNETVKGIELLSRAGPRDSACRVRPSAPPLSPETMQPNPRTPSSSPRTTRAASRSMMPCEGELVKSGTLAEDGRQFLTLVPSFRYDRPRPHLGGRSIKPGDVVQYGKGSKAEGHRSAAALPWCGPATVATNQLTVEKADGSLRYLRSQAGLRSKRLPRNQPRVRNRRPAAVLSPQQRAGDLRIGIWARSQKWSRTALPFSWTVKQKRSVSFDPIGVPAVRPRLCRHVAQRPGTHHRPSHRQHRYRFQPQPYQHPARLRRHLSRIRRREDLHEQRRDTGPAACNRRNQDRRAGLQSPNRTARGSDF